MEVVTLGGLRLEGSTFCEPQPLLLLTYLALHGECLRKTVQTLFWPRQTDTTKRSKSLSEALRRLKKLDPNLLESGRGTLSCRVPVDVQRFRRAVSQKEFERALALYRGPFLYGLEETRLQLGEELSEWLDGERAALQRSVTDVLLTLAKERRQQGDAASARALVLQAFRLPHGVALPSPYTLEVMHKLLLELGFPADAELVQRAAAELQGSFGPSTVNIRRAAMKGEPPCPPVGVTPLFVGRETELSGLHTHFLAGARLVTLTGLAGSGKTELAKAFMQQNELYFGSATFVPLADLKNASGSTLKQALADALGLSGDPENLPRYLTATRTFLVLDNFEVVLEARSVVEQLLRRCPHLRVLVTSRERLGLEDEQILRLTGLSLPGSESTLKQLGRSAAGNLLLKSASQQGAVFDDDDAPLLAELCHQVAGLPLALKLIAGWTASLPLAELAGRLTSTLDTLSATDGVSMKSTFDLSVAVLDTETVDVFSKLAVFWGGFSLTASEHLLGAKPRHLKRLIDASLLTLEGDRYDLHPLLACYVRERYPLTEDLRSQHATFYLTALQTLVQPELGPKNAAGKLSQADLANFSEAWRWAVRQRWTSVLQTALPALQRLCDLLSRPQRGLELVEEAAGPFQNDDLGGSLGVALQASRAWFLLRSSRYAEAIFIAKAALRLDDARARETCLNTLGAAHDALGRFTEGRGYFERVLAYAEPASGEAAGALTNLAINAINRGDYRKARARLAVAERLFTAQDKATKLVWCAYVGGWLALETGHTLEARLKLEQASGQAKALGLLHWALLSRAKLAHLYALEGHTKRAKELGYAVLAEARAGRSMSKEVRAHGTLGIIHLLADEPQHAAEHYLAGLKKARWTQSDPIMLHHLVGLLRSADKFLPCELTANLYTHCKEKVPHMAYADKKDFQMLPVYHGAPSWLYVTTEQVASLVLSLSKSM